MSTYHFDEEMFKINFNAKDPGVKPIDSYRLSHVPDKRFKLYPYKATTRTASPIVYDLSETVSSFFRRTLGVKAESLGFDDLCQKVQETIEIDDADDIETFKDIIRAMFFKDESFQANNIGLYPYQTFVENKSAERVADFLYCVLGLDDQDRQNIKKAEDKYPFNVLEKLVVESIGACEEAASDENKYYQIKHSIQKGFKDDFAFMLSSGMTSVDDISNVLAFYYFYYVSQSVLTLDQFGNGDHERLEKLYYALDWEKVSKNRKCCIEGWDKLASNISRLFSHAITLEIINQNDSQMMDYIDFKHMADVDADTDELMSSEIKRAENVYTSYIGDYHKFDMIAEIPGANKTDSAIRHLFECVHTQFNETERKRASQFYCEKFSEFCKYRFVKNRKKSGLVLNLTERDIIFLTKLALRDKEKIRLNELYRQYELRGIYLDITSKSLLQEYFTKLNLIDKKSDSGDAQYVKRIL